MKMLDYDPMDKYLSRSLKNWTRQVPLPIGSREKLYSRIKHQVPTIPIHHRLLRLIPWVIRNLILVPLDFLFSPIVYYREDELQSARYYSHLDLSLAVRPMADNTLLHNIEIFTYIT
jgi:hypothetical protein